MIMSNRKGALRRMADVSAPDPYGREIINQMIKR